VPIESLEKKRARYAWKCVLSLVHEKRREEDEKSGLLKEIEGHLKEKFKKENISEELDNYYKSLEEKYKSYVKRAPSLIYINGLGNVMAFYRSKFANVPEGEMSADKRAYKLLYEHISKWLKEQLNIDSNDIIEWITSESTSSIDIFQAAREAISLLSWMKRFAEAKLRGEEE